MLNALWLRDERASGRAGPAARRARPVVSNSNTNLIILVTFQHMILYTIVLALLLYVVI